MWSQSFTLGHIGGLARDRAGHWWCSTLAGQRARIGFLQVIPDAYFGTIRFQEVFSHSYCCCWAVCFQASFWTWFSLWSKCFNLLVDGWTVPVLDMSYLRIEVALVHYEEILNAGTEDNYDYKNVKCWRLDVTRQFVHSMTSK